jgi:hypothetical protein
MTDMTTFVSAPCGDGSTSSAVAKGADLKAAFDNIDHDPIG